jgi:tetratricopeptide (TPR) repeat protein
MLSLGNIIVPFQNRLQAFFLYPFQLTPLLLTLALSILGALFNTSFLVNLFVWVVMMKYAYATLIATGQGALKAPDVTWELINGDVLQVFKQFILFAIIGFSAGAAFEKAGMLGGFGFLTVIFLAMPAIIMLLVATNSVLHAINPFTFLRIISRIGWPYFLMYLFLFFLMAGPATLFAYIPIEFLPIKFYIFLTLFLKQVYALISYHLMGYVLLQYHKEIGYHVDYEYFMENQGAKKKRPIQTEEEELNAGLAVLIKSGKYDEAIKRLQPYVVKEEVNLDISEKFLQLLKISGQKQKYQRYFPRHLELLIAGNRKQKAIALYSDILEEGADVPAAESLFKIGSWFGERNEVKKAINVYVLFLKEYKNHALQPEVYFGLAKLLHERAGNSAKARQILKALLKTYPEHALAADAKKYLMAVG